MNQLSRRFAIHAGACLITAASCVLAAFPASAQQTSTVMETAAPMPQAPASGAQWAAGVGVWSDRKALRGVDDDVRVLPLLVYVNRYVSILGPMADLRAGSAGPVSFSLRARYAGEGYDAGDSPFLAGMADRKASFWLGGAATWRGDIANLSAELLADVSGHSKGARFRVQADRRFAHGAFGFTPRVAAQWLDSRYVDYYYGVRAAEAVAGRPFYEPGSAMNLEAGLRVDFTLMARHEVFMDVSASRLGSAIRSSPIVERSTASALRAGYLYRF